MLAVLIRVDIAYSANDYTDELCARAPIFELCHDDPGFMRGGRVCQLSITAAGHSFALHPGSLDIIRRGKRESAKCIARAGKISLICFAESLAVRECLCAIVKFQLLEKPFETESAKVDF